MHVVIRLKTGCMHSDSYQSYAGLEKSVKLLVVLSQSRSVRCLTSQAGIVNPFNMAGDIPAALHAVIPGFCRIAHVASQRKA